ncbi:DUF1868 domain-containing protein [Acidovorax sp. Root402]|uniref:DUF1868 domain-containing protein n=1 Tax=Acidovorax sp. Root402 TaxID=1736527 RepID=UPI0009EB177A|nr:DUF1868 domain-containing protein [Acidovorax sp. Root402]
MNAYSRRQLIASAAALTSVQLAHAQIGAPEAHPRDVGRKMNADGTVRGFVANTFIGHLAQQGEDFAVFDAFLDIYREFPRHAFSQKIGLLPPSSYHITVFGGLNDVDRGTSNWPPSIPVDRSIESVTTQYLRELRNLPKLSAEPFLFDIDKSQRPSLQKEGALTIPLRPLDNSTDRRLRAIRDQLSTLSGLRRRDHDSYQYHVTIGYFFRFLNEQEAHDLSDSTARWMEGLAALPRKPRISSIYFCRLRDMYAYEELHQL